ncbi:hypothetical protein ACEPAH_6700 [Sanghuangporus vaninii]
MRTYACGLLDRLRITSSAGVKLIAPLDVAENRSTKNLETICTLDLADRRVLSTLCLLCGFISCCLKWALLKESAEREAQHETAPVLILSALFKMFGFSAIYLAVLSFLLPSVLGQFNLKDNFVGNDFFSGFKWETFDDPTHGRVNYVDQDTAKANNLSYATDTTFVMRPDSTKKLDSSTPRGRDSIRITSHNTYTDSVVVLDVAHMPYGCATWPAFWTVTAGKWPYGGEIDILEGVNDGPSNLASLHTSKGCTMPQNRKQTGTPTSVDCDATSGSNQGCGNSFTKPNSYGSSLNGVGGGWFVMRRTNKDGAAVYFWARNDPSVPDEIKSGAKTVNPDDSWGEPEALFPTDTCNWGQHFDAHTLVFDLTFCGDWAGSSFSCGGKCEDYVDQNPDKFKDAYWEVNAVRVYTP